MSEKLTERRAALRAELDELLALDAPTPEQEERADAILAEIEKVDSRREALAAAEAREAKAAEARKGTESEHRATVTSEPATYGEHSKHSWFMDVAEARRGDSAAAERLVRNNREQRAGDLSVGGSNVGSQFAPPAWLVDQFVALARPGRVTADLMNRDVLPTGVSSINLPKVSSGTAVAVQGTENTAVQDTALGTTSVSSGITTLSGQQTVSLQLLQQSGVSFDRVVLQDLAADYAKQLDLQVISGSGSSGQLKGLLSAGYASVTYTDATPGVVGTGKLYAQIASAISTVHGARFQSPTVIVMHPRRWAWIAAAFDGSNRPLVVPSAPAFNAIGTQSAVAAQGHVGEILGLPVYVDPNIPTNLGGGTNEDRILVLRAEDAWLYESAMQSASFDATYANQLTVLFRVHGYAAFIPHRYTTSGAVIGGTGLVAPTF